MTRTELAWLAGWLEGEGSFLSNVSKRGYTRLAVRAVSVDLETIERVQAVAGGRVWGPYQYEANRQPHWHWGVSCRRDAVNLMQRLRPLMGTRRQSQIDRAIRVGGLPK